MTVLTTASRSRAEDAAHRAVADIGATIDPGDYRLVGGQMVTLLVARYQPPDAPARTTADADVGVRMQVVADGAFVDDLTARGYVKRGGNRFIRDGDTIDVLVPAAASRARHNRRVGALVVDEVAGLSFALSRPVESADVDVALTDGTSLHYAVSLPDALAALVLKTLAWNARLVDKDVTDVHRCLAVARVAGVTPDAWPDHSEAVRARELLRGRFATRRSTAVRALIAATCGPLTRTHIP